MGRTAQETWRTVCFREDRGAGGDTGVGAVANLTSSGTSVFVRLSAMQGAQTASPQTARASQNS